MGDLKMCPICHGACQRAVIVEINGVVDESMTRPCGSCLGDGWVWLTDTGILPYRAYRTGRTYAAV